MKKIFTSIFVVACLFGASQAKASLDNVLAWATINVNTGHTSVDIFDDPTYGAGYQCTPTSQACTNVHPLQSAACSNTTGYYELGTTPSGMHCCGGQRCVNYGGGSPPCPFAICDTLDNATPSYRRAQKLAIENQLSDVQNPSGQDLGAVFGEPRTNSSFYAYVDTVLRSPNAGRTLWMDAKLDACIGWTNLNSLISNYPNDPYGGWSTCTGSGYCGSVKNAYCTANSNQVCIDRCNCKYQSALTSLGYADPGCSNL